MLIEYIQGALEKAEYKRLEDMTWFAEIPENRDSDRLLFAYDLHC